MVFTISLGMISERSVRERRRGRRRDTAEPESIGGDRDKIVTGVVQENAVEVRAGCLVRGRKRRPGKQVARDLGIELDAAGFLTEDMRLRQIGDRKHRQLEPGPAGGDRCRAVVGSDGDLGVGGKMPHQVREPFQRHRHLALGLGLEPGRDGAVESGGGDGQAITVGGEADGPQRGNAPGLPLANWKRSQAERGDQRAGLGLDEACHHPSIARISTWQPAQTIRAFSVSSSSTSAARSLRRNTGTQGRQRDLAATNVGDR